MKNLVDVTSHLFVLETVEKEDEDALERVQDGEDVGHGDSRFVQIEQAERPSQTQKEDQDERATNPNPVLIESDHEFHSSRQSFCHLHNSIRLLPSVSQTGLFLAFHHGRCRLVTIHDPNGKSQKDKVGLNRCRERKQKEK